MDNHLIIGNKNYSSWSLRPWLLMTVKEIPFKESKVLLYQDGTRAALLAHSPSAKVPVLVHQGQAIWDSMAICETLAEQYPEKNCWPVSWQARADARTICNEMHSGFFELRNQVPMNCRKKILLVAIDAQLQTDISRVCDIWKQCRTKYQEQGAYLFGSFSIADAMFAPVVVRFENYGISVPAEVRQYMDTMLSLPALQQWVEDAKNETEEIDEAEV